MSTTPMMCRHCGSVAIRIQLLQVHHIELLGNQVVPAQVVRSNHLHSLKLKIAPAQKESRCSGAMLVAGMILLDQLGQKEQKEGPCFATCCAYKFVGPIESQTCMQPCANCVAIIRLWKAKTISY